MKSVGGGHYKIKEFLSQTDEFYVRQSLTCCHKKPATRVRPLWDNADDNAVRAGFLSGKSQAIKPYMLVCSRSIQLLSAGQLSLLLMTTV